MSGSTPIRVEWSSFTVEGVGCSAVVSGGVFATVADVIASVSFRNFKALRNASVRLAPFNLIVGPNGSGKTSLIESCLMLRQLARLPAIETPSPRDPEAERGDNAPEVTFRFTAPYDGWEVLMGCASEDRCDLLQPVPLPTGGGLDDWSGLRRQLQGTRSYVLDHQAMAKSHPHRPAAELSADGGNFVDVLLYWRHHTPETFSAWIDEVLRLLPEYSDVRVHGPADPRAPFALKLAEENQWIPASSLSQGTLYALALLVLALDPAPPPALCIEELDRGIHPRLLRDLQDALYRLSYPDAFGLNRRPVQVLATTHSPYLLDLFKEHPEEVVIAEKRGSAAHFSRLADRSDLGELLREASLGDLWFSGILGGVPDER